ncbi:MAG: hypothetical protein CMJ18_10065 [Phycisphaeraceae bacterium]|nr:hypothetical protein [Phycisphaeraceae bacterium]
MTQFSALVSGRDAPLDNALLVFDYVDTSNFKFAGGYFGQDEWRIGRYSNGTWLVDDAITEPIGLDVAYELDLVLQDGRVTLVVDGAIKLSHDFGGVLDGELGLGTNQAKAVFDDVRVNEIARDLVAPQVTEVLVSGSAWSASFMDHLGAAGLGDGGYRVSVGANQMTPLPWMIDKVTARFSEPVAVRSGDLQISGARGGSIAVTDFEWDDVTSAATWTLGAPVASDRVELRLGSSVRDVAGYALDGEWTEGASTVSGNGIAGGDFVFGLRPAAADVDRDGVVTVFDVGPLRDALGISTGDGSYTAAADLDGSGTVDATDAGVLRAQMGRVLSSHVPPSLVMQAPQVAITITGEDRIVTAPGATTAGSIDLVLQTADGSTVDVMDYALRVRLVGPNAGVDVRLTGGGQAGASPAATAPDPLNDAGSADLLPLEHYVSTVNLGPSALHVADGAGLVRIDYEIDPAALGTYRFEILDGAVDGTALSSDGSGAAWSFGILSPTVTVTIPGDTDGDFTVGVADLNAVLANFTQQVDLGDLGRGDLSGPQGVPDGLVGSSDLQVVLATFTNQVTPRAAAAPRAWHGWQKTGSAPVSAPIPTWTPPEIEV